MKYGASTTSTETSGGVGAPQQFAIQASAIAFETLSSRLYAYPIRAVIRELSCNAYDAHVMSGKGEKPFIVQLPTNFDASFKIRDFGPGMSHDEVMQLYCTYFASNKNARNDAIGAFGLGSKSPFAYFLRNGKPGGFAVVSYQNGTARTYAAFIDNGFPKVELQSEAETTEPDGLEVIFPVEQRDVWEFENEARNVYEFFDPKPSLNKEVDSQRPAYAIETKRWGLRQDAETAQGNNVRAIMGGVAYAVGNIDISRLTEQQQGLVTMPLDIFFEIGEVNPAVSRETLQLDDNTIKAIQKALDEVHDGILDEVKKMIDAAPSAWEGKMVVWNLLNHNAIAGIVNAAYNKGQLAGTYTNFQFDASKSLKLCELDYDNVQVTRYERNWRSRSNAGTEDLFGMNGGERDAARRAMEKAPSLRDDYEHEIEAKPEVAFILDDMKPGRSKRYITFFVQNRANDNPEKRTAYVISIPKEADQKKGAVEVVKVLMALGNPPTMLTSSLVARYPDAFPKRQPAPRGRGLLKFNEHSYYNSRRSGGCWRSAWRRGDETIPDLPGKKLYVVINKEREAVTGLPGVTTPRSLTRLLEHMRETKLFGFNAAVGPVYGLKADSKLLNDDDWVELGQHVKDVVAKTMTPKKEAAMSLRIEPYSNNWEFVMERVAKNLSLDVDSPFQNFAIELVAARKASAERTEHLASILGIVGYKVTNVTDFSALWKPVEALYPLLVLCDKHSYKGTDAEADAMLDYIRMMDTSRKPVAEEPKKSKLDAYRERKNRNQKRYYEKKRKRQELLKAAAAGELTVESVDSWPVAEAATAA
jgi:hypothetical protein